MSLRPGPTTPLRLTGVTAAAAQDVFARPDGMSTMFKLPFGEIPGQIFIGMRTSDVLDPRLGSRGCHQPAHRSRPRVGRRAASLRARICGARVPRARQALRRRTAVLIRPRAGRSAGRFPGPKGPVTQDFSGRSAAQRLDHGAEVLIGVVGGELRRRSPPRECPAVPPNRWRPPHPSPGPGPCSSVRSQNPA